MGAVRFMCKIVCRCAAYFSFPLVEKRDEREYNKKQNNV